LTDRKTILLAIVTVLLLGTPIEFLAGLRGFSVTANFRWLVLLQMGAYVQACLVLPTAKLVLIPLARARGGSNPRVHERLVIFLAGLIVAHFFSYGWYDASRLLFKHFGHGEDPFVSFNLRYSLSVPPTVQALAYYRHFAVLNGVLSSLVAAHFAIDRSTKTATLDRLGDDRRERSTLFWSGIVLWLLVYRVPQMLFTGMVTSAVQISDSFLGNASSLISTTVICALLLPYMIRRVNRTRRWSILNFQAASLGITFIAALLLLPSPFLSAGVLQQCLLTLNAGGFFWGWRLGDLCWSRPTRLSPLATAKSVNS
jgi:hypothetical protein